MHFPFCKHLCNYCDFYKFVPKSESDILNHQKLMEKNYHSVTRLINDNGYTWGELDTLFLGGGTPSLWGVDGAKYLKDKFKAWGINLSETGEFTVEFNPGSLDLKTLNAFKDAGFNRFSVGMQSLNSEFIKTLDRIHSLEDCFDILKLMKNEKLNYSIDLMIGLPFSREKKRDVISELKRALDYNPSHFSVYILTVGNNYLYERPDENYIADEYLKVSEFLKMNGYPQYEVSNFAKTGFESRHNLQYWKSNSVAALGPSATGFLADKKLRFKCGPDYERLQIEQLSDEEFYLEKNYMILRTNLGLEINHFDDQKKAMECLKRWRDLGYLENNDEESIVLNSKGYLLIDSLINEIT